MNPSMKSEASVKDIRIALDRDVFLRTLIRELAGALQDIVGLEEASGFISVVGQNMGRQIDQEYRVALGALQLTQQQVADVLVDLKQRIQGDFYVIEQTEEKLVFGNRVCPFGEKAIDRPAMCMMTSNVFGCIAADNLGYAKVELQETIAKGADECRVVIYLKHTPEAEASQGREYFKGESEG
ncbi:transcriptional regulator [[Phormidium ambiguum] IAM M-71]|uniref:Transcriptional regulator n=2 Tax=[Phormidium ambiguum] IAM M-71 TaxID=454136 RepID=A0A1U7IIH8_9CYAN|nr:transcriptional regulator [Phormidium ambiguum IAM M-71]